jgi:hypothetical protein
LVSRWLARVEAPGTARTTPRSSWPKSLPHRPNRSPSVRFPT